MRETVERVEAALEALEGLPAAPRETALEAVGALVDLYGEGWARALALLGDACPGGGDALADDELIGHLLMIHGLHPRDVESRVRAALEDVAETVSADGVRPELVAVEEGVARLRFRGNGHAPAAGFRQLVETAVLRAAPELEGMDVEEPADAGARTGGPKLVQLRRGPRPTGDGPEAAEGT